MKLNRILLSLVGIMIVICAWGQEQPSSDKGNHEYIEKRYTIFFPVGRSEVELDYKGNGHTIQTMVNDLNKTLESEGIIPDSFTIFASTSPEGSAALNERLAIQRANNAKNVLVDILPLFKPENIKVTNRANDWSGMILTLRRDSTFAYGKVLLKLLTDPTVKNKDAAIRSRLPEAYAAIRDKMFDNMRTASVTIRVIKTADNVDEFVVDPELIITSETQMGVSADGGDGKVEYKKNIEEDGVIPVVSTETEWIKDIVPTTTATTFVVEPNRLAQKRSATVIVDCYGKQQKVVIEQEAAQPEYHLTSKSPMDFPAEGGRDTITYETNVPEGIQPDLVCSEDWVKAEVAEDGKISVSVEENKAQKARSASVSVKCLDKVSEVIVNQAAAEKVLKPFYMALKSNMLYDLGIIPNGGVEFYLGKNFSAAANWMYAWWKSDPKAWYWRTYGGDLAVRWWFGKKSKEKPLQGHHLGLYGQILTYDFEVGGRGYLGDKWSYGGGLEYGYSLPVAKRLNIDFTLGVGYIGGEFKEYLPIDGHYVWQVTKQRHWFGPAKAEISLVWLLGRGNENEGKGGKR